MNKNMPTPEEEVNYNKNKYEYLKTLDTARLETMLQQESFISDDSDYDTELIRQIVDILNERDPELTDIDVEASLKTFREEMVPELKSENYDFISYNPKSKKRTGLKRIALIAAVLAILLAGIQVANAFGFDLWKYVVSWGKETFRISTGSDAQEEPGTAEDVVIMQNEKSSYDSMEGATAAFGSPILYPSWIPDGFEFVQAEITGTPRRKILVALYQSGDRTLMYQAVIIQEGDFDQYYELDEGSGEVLILHGIDHYFMTNMGQNSVVWIKENCSYSISGDISKDELTEMINSIYEGED